MVRFHMISFTKSVRVLRSALTTHSETAEFQTARLSNFFSRKDHVNTELLSQRRWPDTWGFLAKEYQHVSGAASVLKGRSDCNFRVFRVPTNLFQDGRWSYQCPCLLQNHFSENDCAGKLSGSNLLTTRVENLPLATVTLRQVKIMVGSSNSYKSRLSKLAKTASPKWNGCRKSWSVGKADRTTMRTNSRESNFHKLPPR